MRNVINFFSMEQILPSGIMPECMSHCVLSPFCANSQDVSPSQRAHACSPNIYTEQTPNKRVLVKCDQSVSMVNRGPVFIYREEEVE